MEYRIEYTETYSGDYYVEAADAESAEEKFNDMMCNGEIDFKDLEMTDSSVSAKEENPPKYTLSLTEEEILLLSDGLLSLIERAGKSPVSDPAVNDALSLFRGRCQILNSKILRAPKSAPTENPADGTRRFTVKFMDSEDYQDWDFTVDLPDTYTAEKLEEELRRTQNCLLSQFREKHEVCTPIDVIDEFNRNHPSADWADYNFDVEIERRKF